MRTGIHGRVTDRVRRGTVPIVPLRREPLLQRRAMRDLAAVSARQRVDDSELFGNLLCGDVGGAQEARQVGERQRGVWAQRDDRAGALAGACIG